VVLLHGWMCNRGFWREQVGPLSASHRVLALDFRGHGGSEVTDPGYTLDRLAEDVHEAMRALDATPAVVVGHSMGGMVAQRLAAVHPGKLTALVLVTTTAAADRSLISRRIRDDTPAEGFRAALLRHFPGWFLPTSDHELAEWVRSEMLRTPEHVALSLVDDYADVDLRPGLPHIQVPTLVIGATGDASTPPLMSEEIARLVPGATLAVIDGAGHFVQLERPREVNQALLEFFHSDGEVVTVDRSQYLR